MNISIPASTAGLASTVYVTGISGALQVQINQGGGGGVTLGQLSGVSGDGRAIQFVTQTNHGYSGGQVLYGTNGLWSGALATAASPALGVVEQSGSSSTFTVVTAGLVNLKANQFTANTAYYVSDVTAGYLTATAPTGYNSFYNPVLYTVSSTAGYVLPSWPASLSTIPNSSLAAMPANTIKSNPTSVSASPVDALFSGAGYVSLFYSSLYGAWIASGMGSSGVYVSGSSIIATPTFTGAGGVQVYLTGASTVVISGGAGVTNAQVTGSTNLSNLNISGTNGITTSLQGSTLLISTTNAGSTTGTNVTVTGGSTLLTANLVGAGDVTLSVAGTTVTISGFTSPVNFNVQTGAYYTLTAADQYNWVAMSGTQTQYLVLPTGNGLATGSQFIIEQYGTGVVYVLPTGNVVLQSRGGVSGFGGQFAGATLTLRSYTTWSFIGDIA